MTHGLWASRILLVSSLAALGPVLAQAPPGAPSTPATSPAGTPAAPAAQGSDSSSASTESPAPPSAPTATPSAAPATSPPPAAPSADTLKKARMAGYRPETKNGTTMYCQETANLGTRFPTKKCLNEQQLNGVVDIQHQQQDSMRKPINCMGGPGCGAG